MKLLPLRAGQSLLVFWVCVVVVFSALFILDRHMMGRRKACSVVRQLEFSWVCEVTLLDIFYERKAEGTIRLSP